MSVKNKVILCGRLGADPQQRIFETGNSVTEWTLATNESYTNKMGDKVESTQRHRCQAWGKLGDVIVKHFKSGQEMLMEGKIQYSYRS